MKLSLSYTDICRNLPLGWIGLIATVVPLVPVHMYDTRLHWIRTGSFELGAALLIITLAVRPAVETRASLLSLWRSVPFRLLTVLLLWGIVSAALAPTKELALQGLILLAGGVLVTGVIGAGARDRPQYTLILNTLAVAEILVAMSGFVFMGRDNRTTMQGLYDDHMLYGAALLLPLPILVAVSSATLAARQRVLYQAGVLCGSVALLMSLTRSAWLGMIGALAVYFALHRYCAKGQPKRKPTRADKTNTRWRTVLAGIVAACALVVLLLLAPQAGQVEARLQSLTRPLSHDANIEWRFAEWQDAREMIARKPVFGWGIGGYPEWHHRSAGTYSSTATPTEYLTVFDQAHNSYLQWAAETGLPGLVLWISVLGSAVVCAVRSLRGWTYNSLRQRALCGASASLVGQSIDAFANPGWQYGEVSLFLWIVLGLTLALTMPVTRPAAVSDVSRFRVAGIAFQAVISLVIVTSLLLLIKRTVPFLPSPWL